MTDNASRKVAIIGMGYVGLALATAFGKVFPVIGFDTKTKRINELLKNIDRNKEYSAAELEKLSIKYTHNEEDLREADFYIVTVPTPITVFKLPDLEPLYNASSIIAKYLKKGDIVVYESTVYPGATEEDCLPILEKHSGLKSKVDFTVGYSPERINPTDRKHTVENTIKIISAQDEPTLNVLAEVYGKAVKAGLYKASSIKVAEAAKVVENTQRDVNISLINEISLIMQALDIDTLDVLEAAQTKWNFLSFKPGLVGGHCIGVDPYYLAYKAEEAGYYPDIILAGRRVNDLMGKQIAEKTIKVLISLGVFIKKAKIAVLGITFKEDCADTRNSRVFDMIQELQSYDTEVLVHDPVANNEVLKDEKNLNMVAWEDIKDVHAIILAVSHKYYYDFKAQNFIEKMKKPGVIMDIKGILEPEEFTGSDILIWRM